MMDEHAKKDASNPQYPADEALDQRLVHLEQWAEQEPSSSSIDSMTEFEKSFHDVFRQVDALTAPLRNALKLSLSPPSIPDYGPLEEVGRGGMGIVYRGTHLRTHRVDAIKVIRPDRLAVGSQALVHRLRERFQRECQLAARVSHEHIVPIYQVGDVGGCIWFSMQYLAGKSLLEKCQLGELSQDEIVRCMERISRAVDAVHQCGVIHGDIKPQNILFDNQTSRPMIGDFGLAELASELEGNEEHVAGTPAYMAPELIRAIRNQEATNPNASVHSVAIDIYSLGATLGSMLTQRNALPVSVPLHDRWEEADRRRSRLKEHLLSDTDPSLARICLKCLADEPSHRYASAGDLADDLLAWLERPRWNQFFPNLRYLLSLVVAPGLALSGMAIWLLQEVGLHESTFWVVILASYIPLFAALWTSRPRERESARARRELWSIWLGHAVATVACMMSIRIQSSRPIDQSFSLIYSSIAAISSAVFMAKSGNFWSAYRWIGFAWAVASLLLAASGSLSPLLFGIFAAVTCVVIAWGDSAFLSDEPSIRDAIGNRNDVEL